MFLLGNTKKTYAADLFWDNTPGAGTGGTGTWTSGTPWRPGSSTGSPLQAWVDGNNAFFGGTAGTVSISGGTVVSPITSVFQVTGYSLTSTSTTVATLGGTISLSPGVNLNMVDSAETSARQLNIGSVTGGAGAQLTISGSQTTSNNVSRINLSQPNASIDVPVTIGGSGTTAAGFVATATGVGINGSITNNSSRATLLGATLGNDLTLSASAVISGSAGVTVSLSDTADNAGMVTLNSANSYVGGTTLDGGTLRLGDNAALGSGTLTLSNSSSSILQAVGSPRTISNSVIWGGNGTISGENAITINGSFTGSGALTRIFTANNSGGTTLGGNVYLAESETSRTLQIAGTEAVAINGVITNNNAANTISSNLRYSGSSILTLAGSNTYTGTTRVDGGGTLSVSSLRNFGQSSSVGQASSGDVTIGATNSSGILNYTGNGDATNRTVQIGTNSITAAATDTGGATIQNNGSGVLVFNATNFNTATNASTGVGANRTLTLSGSNTGSNTISGVIRDNIVSGTATGTATVGVTKSGAGTWVLSGDNTYTGATTVNAGTLTVDGSLSSSSAVTVASGATLNGSGTVAGSVTVQGGGLLAGTGTYGATTVQSGGTLGPGNSPGDVTFSSLNLNSGSNFNWDLISNTTSNVGIGAPFFDTVTLTGGALNIDNFNSTLQFGNLVNWGDSFWSTDRVWNVFTGAGSVSLTGTNSPLLSGNLTGYSPSLGSFAWVKNGTTGVDLVYSATAVPEPTSLAFGLVGAGIGLVAQLRRRGKKSIGKASIA